METSYAHGCAYTRIRAIFIKFRISVIRTSAKICAFQICLEICPRKYMGVAFLLMLRTEAHPACSCREVGMRVGSQCVELLYQHLQGWDFRRAVCRRWCLNLSAEVRINGWWGEWVPAFLIQYPSRLGLKPPLKSQRLNMMLGDKFTTAALKAVVLVVCTCS